MFKLKLLVLDIDGILTDGKKYYGKDGVSVYKTFCDKDWTTIKRFKAIGIEVIFLTGDPFNEKIGNNRNITTIVNRKEGYHKDKSEYLPILCSKYKCTNKEIAYFGDDLFDIGIMKLLDLSFCPKDSPNLVKKYCKTIPVKGGNNAILKLYETLEQLNIIPKYSYEEIMGKIYNLDLKEVF